MSRTSFLTPSLAALLLYRLTVILCYQMTAVTVGWHVYQLTGDKLSLGLIGLAEVIPYFASALFAGYAVDHFSKIKLGVMACLLLLGTTGILVLVSSGIFEWLAAWSTWPIYGAIALSGLARSFLSPVYNTLVVKLVERKDFVKVASLGTSALELAKILGPALGGVLIAVSSLTWAYGAAMFCAFLGLVSLSLVYWRSPQVRHHEHADVKHDLDQVFTSIGQGGRFVWGNKILLSAIALDMFAVLFGGAMALLPAFVQDVLHSGPESLGILRAAPAVSALLMGLVLTRYPVGRHAGWILLLMVAGFGVSMIVFALSTSLWLSVAALAASGIFDCVSVVLRSTIFQLTTPDEMRGRVSSITGLFIGSSNELGAFESGVAAAILGLVPSVIFGGCVTFLVVGITAYWSPQLRRLNMKDLVDRH